MSDLALAALRLFAPALAVWAGLLALRAGWLLAAEGAASAFVAPALAFYAALAARREAARLASGLRTDMMAAGSWTFAGVGSLFALIGASVAREEPEGWAVAGFGLVFVGIGRLAEHLTVPKAKPERVEPAPARPGGAAALRVPAAPPDRRSAAAGAAAAALAGALLLGAGALSLGLLALAIGGTLGWRMAGRAAAARRFPPPALALERPLRPGAPFGGRVETGAPPEAFADGLFRLRLECRAGPVAPPLWSRAVALRVTEAEPGRPVIVPFEFDPPESLPGPAAARWRLFAAAEAPGADFAACFDLPPD